MNRAMRIGLAIFLAVAVALTITSLLLLAAERMPLPLRPQPSQSPTVTHATTQPTAVTTVPIVAVAPTPTALRALLTATGHSEADLTAAACTQLVTVDVTDSTVIRFYEYRNGWVENEALRCSGFVGVNGIAANRREGSGTTPIGLYGVGEAFYMHTPPATALPTFRITEDTYWVDDADSAYYNQRVEGTADKDWRSAEHMIDYPDNYGYGFVVEYNTACTPGAGSAIFFHVGSNPTLGCIATTEAMVLNYLAVLDPACNPHILIG